MEKEENMLKSELIPLLIEYKRIIGKVFPVDKVKYLSTEDIIQRLKGCINSNKEYKLNYNLFNDTIEKKDKDNADNLLSNKDFKNIIPLVKLSMENINYNYTLDYKETLEILELRKNGKEFTFSEHLRALLYVQLMNHRWGDNNLRENKYKIDVIFHNYDRNYLKSVDPNILITELRKIHCTNPMTRKQMEALSYNINILERIEDDYGCLDNYVTTNDPNDIANSLYDGKYKLKQFGRAFTFDYLKGVGINTCKSSNPLERMFGYKRLRVVKNDIATAGQVLTIIRQLSNINKLSEIEVESILNQFCLLSSSNICGEVPRCEKCKLRKMCNFEN